MKKALKIIGIIIVALVVLLLITPFLFKGTIEKQVKKAINENLNATVEWSDLSLSLFSGFPDARLKLKDFSVINKAPFEGDTLVAGKTIFLDMGIPQLFKGGDAPLSINELGLDEAYANVKVNKNGEANYDIAKEEPDADEGQADENDDLSLDIKHYEINDSRLNYLDEDSKMFLRLKELNHEGTGDFSAGTSTLSTKTDALVSFAMDSTEYLSENSFKLDADIKMDLDAMKFSFKDNEALVNQLPLEFDGFVQVNEDNQEMDLTFETPSSDFKNFLGLIPKAYSQDLEGVETSGKFQVDGKISGIVDDDHIPELNIKMKSDQASFQYPDLPKSVDDIAIDAVLKDETGKMEDLALDLNQLSFTIDQDQFSANGTMKDLTGNTRVNLTADGTLNLANIDQAYPIDADMDLDGILKADLNTAFEMNDIEEERYENIKSRGSASLSDFAYTSDEFPNPIKISTAELNFDPGDIKLEKFDLKTGQTDAHLTGKLENLMGYLFKEKPVKGNFKLTSDTFSVNDFMVNSETSEEDEDKSEKKGGKPDPQSEEGEAIKIPSFLDIALNFEADKVLYDNLTLTNATGTMELRDETAYLNDVTADIFGGSIGLDGSVATKGETPQFDVGLSLDKLDIAEAFQEMDLLKNLAPVAKALNGNLSTSIDLDGDLTEDLTPVYSSLMGGGEASVLNAEVEQEKMPLVSKLNDKMDFADLDSLHLKDIKAQFKIEDGAMNIKPFDFKIHNDIDAEISGKHSLDNEMDYQMDLDVPAKYLGGDVNKVLSKLSKSEQENTTVDVPVNLSGSFENPKVNVNLKDAAKDLSEEIVEKQKGDLKEKAKEKVQGFLKGDDEEEGDHSEKEDGENDENADKNKTKDKAKKALKGLFGDKEKDGEDKKEDNRKEKEKDD